MISLAGPIPLKYSSNGLGARYRPDLFLGLSAVQGEQALILIVAGAMSQRAPALTRCGSVQAVGTTR
jgi:hypothetical protein